MLFSPAHFFSKKQRICYSLLFVILFSCLGIFFVKDKLAEFFLRSVVRRALPQARMEFTGVDIRPGHLKIGGLTGVSKGGHLSFMADGARAEARFSVLSLWRGFFAALRSGSFSVATIKAPLEIEIRDVAVEFLRQNRRDEIAGDFRIGAILYRKTRIENLSGHFRLGPGALFIDDAGLAAFGGKASCRGRIFFEGGPLEIFLDLHLEHIRAERVLDVLGVRKSISLEGAFGGDIALFLKGRCLADIKGMLRAQGAGMFSVTDGSFISKDVLKKTYTNIMVENMKDYRYDIGDIAVSKVGEDVRVEISLEGGVGRRRLEIIWHGAQL